MCYSNTERKQRTKCVIIIQMSSRAVSVLFLYRGAAVLELCYSKTGAAALLVCYSKTEEQQRWKCVILKLRSSSAGSVLF